MQKCPGLLDRLASNAETSLGHDLVEFETTGGDFTICRQCGYWGIKKAVKLGQRCQPEDAARRADEAWARVFVKGNHPYTNVPFRCAADGVRRYEERTPTTATRSSVIKTGRMSRLVGKTKPWAAALKGIFFEPSAQGQELDEEQMEEEHAAAAGHDIDPTHFFGNDGMAIDEEVVAPVINQVQRDQICINKSNAMERKRKRVVLAAQNKVKAENTKRRKIELNEAKQRADFAVWIKANCPEEENMREDPGSGQGDGRPGSSTDLSAGIPPGSQLGLVEGDSERALEQTMDEGVAVSEVASPGPAQAVTTPDLPEGQLEMWLEQIMEEGITAEEGQPSQETQQRSDAEGRARRKEAASFNDWEMEGAVMQEACSPTQESEEQETQAHVPTVTHTSWCTSVGCKGNCCISALQGTGSRVGERSRQNQAKLIEEAAKRRRIIPSVQDAITPAAKSLARMLEKVRRPIQ